MANMQSQLQKKFEVMKKLLGESQEAQKAKLYEEASRKD